MNILLMCQGQQRRLAKSIDKPKHLLEVGAEAIAARTLRLLRDLEVDYGDAVTVIGPQSLADGMGYWAVPTCLHTLDEPGACIVDGMLASSEFWNGSGRTLVMLGDVVWSRAALEAFVTDRRPVVFAGQSVVSPSQGEVFAVGFDDSQAMRNLCATCPCRVDGKRLRTFRQQVGGHLRRLLWWYQDQHRLRLHPSVKRTWHESVYLPCDDWTKDIDTPEDLERLPELARLAELEDRALDAQAVPVAGSAASGR